MEETFATISFDPEALSCVYSILQGNRTVFTFVSRVYCAAIPCLPQETELSTLRSKKKKSLFFCINVIIGTAGPFAESLSMCWPHSKDKVDVGIMEHTRIVSLLMP